MHKSINIRIKGFFWALIALLIGFSSCSDSIDESNLYSFSGESISSYLKSREDCSEFVALLSKVNLSKKSKSTLIELLSTRGNYTLFVPTNDALKAYITEVTGITDNPTIECLPDSIAEELAKGCIIDNGSTSAYQTSSFQQEGTLDKVNMNDRYITVGFDTMPGTKQAVYLINNNAQITDGDHELENGYVHIVSAVPSSSSTTLPGLIATASNMRIFSRLLQETGWDKNMVKYLDADYEDNHPERGRSSAATGTFPCPEHRKYGYTAFVEPDSVYVSEWQVPEPVVDNTGTITNWNDILNVIKKQCEEKCLYTNTSNDLTSEDNAVNQFVAYHILPMSITFNKLVVHYCEAYFSYADMDKLTVNLDELYTTIGKHRRLMKITEGATTDGKRINRYSLYNPDNRSYYEEMQVDDPGVLISAFNGDNLSNALNGFYYPVNHMVYYSEYTRDKVLNQRLRFDTPSFLPELMSAGIRRPNYRVEYNLPKNFIDEEEITRTDETEMIYKATFSSEWQDYNGDEIQALGQYDFTFLLPPVPSDGTYEFRIGLSNTDSRGMAQVYFGDDKNNLSAVGLPLDMRLTADNPSVGWVKDGNDEAANKENDKTLRNHGYMKAPKIYGFPGTSGATVLMRDFNMWGQLKVRKILNTGYMKAGKKYYCRFKSLLDNPNAQFFFDYIELVPKSVYSNPAKEEDIW